MKDYEPVMTFDETNAPLYDGLAVRGDEDATVAFLADLAGDGPALELAIGTGRIALPLAATGVRVDGVDLSEPMVAQLRAKPGGADIDVTIGDMTEVDLARRYRLVYVVFNSFFNVLSQDAQVRCFENAAVHLEPGGTFVVEGGSTMAFLERLTKGQYVQAEGIEVDAVRFDLLQLDPATQVLVENHIRVTAEGVTFNPVVQRYAWPAELDLMARIAGLRLRERWSGWRRERFGATSENVISVYELPPLAAAHRRFVDDDERVGAPVDHARRPRRVEVVEGAQSGERGGLMGAEHEQHRPVRPGDGGETD